MRVLGSCIAVAVVGCGTFGETSAPEAEPAGDAAAADATAEDGAGTGGTTNDAGTKVPGVDGAPPSPGCLGKPACERVVFVTSATFAGNLGGSGGADAKCQQRADASFHERVAGRSFNAWLSDSTQAVSTRLTQGGGKYVRPDGAPIADGWSDLVDGTLAATISQDENGANVPTGALVWTGSTPVGNGTNAYCEDWSSTALNKKASVGRATDTGASWSNAEDSTCNEQRRLYCIEY